MKTYKIEGNYINIYKIRNIYIGNKKIERKGVLEIKGATEFVRARGIERIGQRDSEKEIKEKTEKIENFEKKGLNYFIAKDGYADIYLKKDLNYELKNKSGKGYTKATVNLSNNYIFKDIDLEITSFRITKFTKLGKKYKKDKRKRNNVADFFTNMYFEERIKFKKEVINRK